MAVNPDGTGLRLPPGLSSGRRAALTQLADRAAEQHGPDLLGLVLSGSVARGMATDRSDLDVYVVLTDDAADGAATRHGPDVDEVPLSWAELAEVPAFGSDGWWYRWSFAWVPVLLDRTGGELPGLVRAQATVDTAEALDVLLTHDRLDGWINYAYRALKNDRDGRPCERRLDAAESVPWLLDTVFTLAGRVRPYHKYLPWELERHPLPDWSAEELLRLVERTLDGDPEAVRETFGKVEGLCRRFDETLPAAALGPVIDGWGSELDLFR